MKPRSVAPRCAGERWNTCPSTGISRYRRVSRHGMRDISQRGTTVSAARAEPDHPGCHQHRTWLSVQPASDSSQATRAIASAPHYSLWKSETRRDCRWLTTQVLVHRRNASMHYATRTTRRYLSVGAMAWALFPCSDASKWCGWTMEPWPCTTAGSRHRNVAARALPLHPTSNASPADLAPSTKTCLHRFTLMHSYSCLCLLHSFISSLIRSLLIASQFSTTPSAQRLPCNSFVAHRLLRHDFPH